MTNGMDMLQTTCACQSRGASDLMPLLIAICALFVVHVAFKEFKKRKGKPEMKKMKNIAIVAALLVAVVAVFAAKQNLNKPADPVQPTTAEAAAPVATPAETTSATHEPASLPRLVDLGATKCIPCKMMAPILEDLKTTYATQMQVEFIDVWENPDAGEKYGIRSIPTQIFYDAGGKELFRHEGFFPKEDILSKWKELGVTLTAPATQTP